MLPCLNKTLFGFECMGCGFQRSLLAIFQGQFLKAFVLYPAIFPIITLLTLIVISKFYKFKYHQKSIYVLATGDFSEFQREFEKAMEEMNQSA